MRVSSLSSLRMLRFDLDQCFIDQVEISLQSRQRHLGRWAVDTVFVVCRIISQNAPTDANAWEVRGIVAFSSNSVWPLSLESASSAHKITDTKAPTASA